MSKLWIFLGDSLLPMRDVMGAIKIHNESTPFRLVHEVQGRGVLWKWRMRSYGKGLLVTVLFLFNKNSFATTAITSTDNPVSFTYVGEVTDLNGKVSTDSNVQLTFQIFSPAGDCLLLEEVQNVDLSSSQGRFSVQIGSVPNSLQRSSHDPQLTMAQVFSNNASVRGADATSCPAGFTSTGKDYRRLRITIKGSDGFSDTLVPDETINSVPYAFVAETIQGLGKDQLVLVDGSQPFTGDQSLGSHKLTNVTDPNAPQDAATKNYVDTTVAGAIGVGLLRADGTVAFTGDQSLGSHKLTNVTNPTAAQDAATKNYVDTQLTANLAGKQNSLGFTPLNIAGDSMSGLLILSADPSASLGAATKQYVDTLIAGIPAAPVDSVFGRTGAITAQSNDYTWAQIDKTLSSLADLTTRSAGDLSSGTLADARLSSNVALKNNSNTFTVGGQVIQISTATDVGLTVKGASSQSADLQQWRSNSNTILYSVSATGSPVVSTDLTSKFYVDNGLASKQDSLGFAPVNKAGDTMSGSLALPSNGLVVGTNQLVVNGGNVGVGTTSPGASTRLYAVGQIVAKDFDNGSSGAFDFANGNASESTFDCTGNISLANLRRGGSYTIAIKGNGSAQCNFASTVTGDDAGTVAYRFAPLNGTRTLNTYTLYNLTRIGDTVYVQWVSGF